MKITYDPEIDVLYLKFRDTTVTTKRVTEDIAIDYDANGKVAGIEVLDAKQNALLTREDYAVRVEGALQPA